MSDPQQPDPGPPSPVGGDRRPLDRAPSERYRQGSGAASASVGPHRGAVAAGQRARRAIVAAALVALGGAVLFFLLGLLDLGIGLVVVAAFAGWTTALALVWWGRDAIPDARTRVATGSLLGGSAVLLGMIVDWVYGLVQGGVLGPLDYVAQRYGFVALLSLAVAVGIAAARAR